MEAAGAEVADLERGFSAQLLFERGTPLLDVLRWRVQLKRGKADGRCAEDGRAGKLRLR